MGIVLLALFSVFLLGIRAVNLCRGLHLQGQPFPAGTPERGLLHPEYTSRWHSSAYRSVLPDRSWRLCSRTVVFVPGTAKMVCSLRRVVLGGDEQLGWLWVRHSRSGPVLACDGQGIKTLTDNLNQRVLPGQGAVNVSAEWKDLGLMSHSLGADSLVQILQRNHTVAKAVAFLEPASTHYSKPLGFSIPALSYGTQLCMEAPQCCLKGYGYFHFYSELVCPKILMNVTGYGHCDMLNEVPGWDTCHFSHICKTDESNN